MQLLQQCKKARNLVTYLHKEIYFCFLLNQPKSGCVYHCPIDFKPNGTPFRSKSIEKLVNTTQVRFDLARIRS